MKSEMAVHLSDRLGLLEASKEDLGKQPDVSRNGVPVRRRVLGAVTVVRAVRAVRAGVLPAPVLSLLSQLGS